MSEHEVSEVERWVRRMALILKVRRFHRSRRLRRPSPGWWLR